MKTNRLSKIASAVLLGTGLAAFCLVSSPTQAKPKTKTGAKKTAAKAPAARQIRWHTSINDAMDEAQQTNKPIFVDFYATWCPPCKMMERQTFPHPMVIAESQKWVMLKIDVDVQTDVKAHYRVSKYPTLMILRPDSRPITSVSGYIDPSQLIQMMRYYYKPATTT